MKTEGETHMPSGDQEQKDPVKKLDAQVVKAAAHVKGDEPLAINRESQLFIDDFLIANRTSAHRRLNRPHKEREPFLVADQEWEGQSVLYGSIIEQDDEYWLYYKARNWTTEFNFDQFQKKHGYGKYPVCVARSSDGVEFGKEPLEGAVHPDTNIVLDAQMDCFGVVRDVKEEDPGQRFKLLAAEGNWWAGLTPAASPDGIRWTWGEPHAVAFFGDRCSYWYDPVRAKHIAWSRNYQLMGGRVIVHKETDDFSNWSDIRASHPKLVMMPDRDDHPMTQFYGGYGFWYRSMYLAYLEVYYIHHQRIDTQLACSRDGIHWERLCDRDVFLPNGEHGEFDAYWIVPTFNPPVIRNGELLIHCNGRPDPHAQPGFTHVPPGMGGSFGLSRLREDGFVSLDATGSEGVVETKPLKLLMGRSRLELNVCPFNTRTGHDPMQVEVEVLTQSGEPMSSHTVRHDPGKVWSVIELPVSLPEVIQLRFHMRNARLYSFRFPED